MCALPLSEVTFLPASRFSFGVTLKSTEDAHPSFMPNLAWGAAHLCAAQSTPLTPARSPSYVHIKHSPRN
ncbi:hypothetical protein [Microcoleus sp. FACHB-672]|uniref:hypothetical protein n=1 Tax=Microcoleus sp. FACHB-672 TaxID=2692825 RepID=UPI001686A643|nr:hypothetical protein [Microcoleus sp. FACHB-672]